MPDAKAVDYMKKIDRGDLSVYLFLAINKNKNRTKHSYLRISEQNNIDENNGEVAFSKNASKYKKDDIKKIIYAFNIEKIEIPDKRIYNSVELIDRCKPRPFDILEGFYNPLAKGYIFCVKKTLKTSYMQELIKQKIVVPAILDDNKLIFYSKQYDFDGKKYSMIVGFTDTEEASTFVQNNRQSNYKNKDKRYALLGVTISELIRRREKGQGIILNPNSIDICGKNLSFSLSPELLDEIVM